MQEEQAIQPGTESPGEVRVPATLQSDPALDLADGYDAEVEVHRPLAGQPVRDGGYPFRSAVSREYVRVQEEH